MKRTSPSPLNQEPNRNSLTFSIPRALIPIPILSHTEQMIISRITNLSDKYSIKGGCNLPNRSIAQRHECALSTVSIAISKATWLGMLQCRDDKIEKHKNKDGSVSITQRRRLKLVIPEVWTYFGEKWADFYFKGDEETKQVLDWIKNYVNEKYKEEQVLRKKEKTEEIETDNRRKLDLPQMIKMMVLEFKRRSLENQMAPFINQKGSLLEEPMLLMFTKVNVYGSKCLNNNTPTDKSLENPSNEKEPSNSPDKALELNSTQNIPNKKPSAKERSKTYLPTAKYLATIIQTNKNIVFTSSQINQWSNEIRKLAETNKIEHKRVRKALKWYAKHIEDQYTPVIECGGSLRTKFLKLENAMNNGNYNTKKSPSRGATPIPGKYPEYDILYDPQKGIIDDKREANGRCVE